MNNSLPNKAIVNKGFEFNYKDSKSKSNKKKYSKNKKKYNNYGNNYNNNNNFNFNFENDKFSLGISTPISGIATLLTQSLGNALFNNNK